VAIPTIDAFIERVADVRSRCERIGRDPASVEIIATGQWRMLDVRDGLDAEQMRDDLGRLAACGTDWVTFNLCGDDPGASIETLEWFAQELIAAG